MSLNDAAALVDDADVCLTQRHFEAQEEIHGMNSLICCDTEHHPNVDGWRKARSAHLYRQSQILAQARIKLHRSTLADWIGTAGFHLGPVEDWLAVL